MPRSQDDIYCIFTSALQLTMETSAPVQMEKRGKNMGARRGTEDMN